MSETPVVDPNTHPDQGEPVHDDAEGLEDLPTVAPDESEPEE